MVNASERVSAVRKTVRINQINSKTEKIAPLTFYVRCLRCLLWMTDQCVLPTVKQTCLRCIVTSFFCRRQQVVPLKYKTLRMLPSLLSSARYSLRQENQVGYVLEPCKQVHRVQLQEQPLLLVDNALQRNFSRRRRLLHHHKESLYRKQQMPVSQIEI